jgi:acid phosphatase
MFPPSTQGSNFIPHICVRNKKDENLYPNTSACKRLDTLMSEFAQGATSIEQIVLHFILFCYFSAAAISMNPTLEPLDQKLSKYIDGKPIRVDGSPRASGILETVSSCQRKETEILTILLCLDTRGDC